MVLPLIGALAGGGASIAAAMIGAESQNEAMLYNYYVDLLNYYQRERERRESKQFAEQVRGEQKLGATDALGNRTRFVPGQGWVTEADPQLLGLMRDQLDEQQRVLRQDLPAKRDKMFENLRRQDTEGVVADQLLSDFRGLEKPDAERIRRLIIGDQVDSINEGFADAQSQYARDALRTASSNTPEVMAEFARSQAEAVGEVLGGSHLQARALADQQYGSEREALANLYNVFATRAGAMPDVSYAPMQADSGANSLLSTFAQLAQQGNQFGLAANMKQGGEYSFVEPNTGYADAIGAAGSAISGIGNAFGAQQSRSRGEDMLRQFMQQGGSASPLYGAILNDMQQRSLSNQGMF